MSTALGTVRDAVRRARFDPRAVAVAFVIMALSLVGAAALASSAANKADKVAAPVAMLCRQGGQTGAALGNSGACGAADNTTTIGPYVRTEAVAGRNGSNGERGQAGVSGQAGADSTVPGRTGDRGPAGADATGTPGTNGTNGTSGVDGVTPACVSEPGQCRGADGQNGVDGKNGVDGQNGQNGVDGTNGQDGAAGPPGPTCPEGTSLQPVTFFGGQSGLGCVTDAPATPPSDAPGPTE